MNRIITVNNYITLIELTTYLYYLNSMKLYYLYVKENNYIVDY